MTEECSGNIAGGPHLWHLFPGGRGCFFCTAWISFRPQSVHVEPLPARYPAFHVDDPLYLSYGRSVGDESKDAVDLAIMNELLPIARLNVTYAELEQVVERIVAAHDAG